MNWVCDSCGYENEYNDESQPTECLCCGEPVSEYQLNQARRELEEYHKEQERQRKLEQLRQEAIKRQERIEHSIKSFIKSVKFVAAACIAVMILSIAFAGFNIYKGNVSFQFLTANIKSIGVMDEITTPVKTISDLISENAIEYKKSIVQNASINENVLEFKDNFIPNVSNTIKKRDDVVKNLSVLAERNKKSIADISTMIQTVGDNSKVGYENRINNFLVSQNNISNGYSNFTENWKLFWNQAIQNINQLVDSISKIVGRSK